MYKELWEEHGGTFSKDIIMVYPTVTRDDYIIPRDQLKSFIKAAIKTFGKKQKKPKPIGYLKPNRYLVQEIDGCNFYFIKKAPKEIVARMPKVVVDYSPSVKEYYVYSSDTCMVGDEVQISLPVLPLVGDFRNGPNKKLREAHKRYKETILNQL